MKLVLVFLMSIALFNCAPETSPSGNDGSDKSSESNESSSQAGPDECVGETADVLFKQSSVIAGLNGACQATSDCENGLVCELPGEGCVDEKTIPDVSECDNGFYCQGDECVQKGVCIDEGDSCRD